MMMPVIVGTLDALTALLCAGLLWRGFVGNRQHLLLWSALCFLGLSLANALLVLDIWRPDVDLHLARMGVAALAWCLLLFGLVWETHRP